MTAEWVQAVAAIATFLAAALAVWATITAPRRAAAFAEDLRVKNQRADEERRQKVWVLTTLMQNRATIKYAHAALNVIDVIFVGSAEVRAAWRHFLAGATPNNDRVTIERYLALIEKIAADLGLGGALTVADIHNAYYPELLGQIEHLQMMELLERLQRFKGDPKGAS